METKPFRVNASEEYLLKVLRVLFKDEQGTACQVLADLVQSGMTRPGSWEADCLSRTQLPDLCQLEFTRVEKRRKRR